MWLTQPALAQECASPYTVDELLSDLVSVEEFLRHGDPDAALSAGTKLETGLGCLGELLPSMIAGRSYRAVGGAYVASGNADKGQAWFHTSTEIDQSFDYGLEDLPETHPIRDAYAAAKANSGGEKVAIDGMGWAIGKNYLDGRKQDKPAARLDRPHIYQRDDNGIKTWLIDGNAFPAEALAVAVAVVAAPEPTTGATGKPPKQPKAPKEPKAEKPGSDKPPKVAKAPKEPKAEKPPKDQVAKAPKPAPVKKPKPSTGTTGGAVTISRQRPAEKTPLIIAGGAVVGGAAAIYAMALSSKGKFNDAGTVAELTDLQKTTNRLVIVSAATLAVGTGTFTWGVILDGSAPLPAVKFRF